MLRWRLVLGAALIAALVGLLWLDHLAQSPGTWLFPLAVVLALAAVHEALALVSARDEGPLASTVYAGTLLVVVSNSAALMPAGRIAPAVWPLAALGGALLLVFLGEIVRFREAGPATTRVALAMLVISYVGVCTSFLVQLRLLGRGEGLAALASLVLVVKLCDTGAYTCGRIWGRHKLAPRLSPGKTIEGLAGGLVWALAGSWWAIAWLAPRLSERPLATAPGAWIWFGLSVAAAGVVGDLAESLLKRDAGQKDSSAWMPGFGGVLDVLDSILLAAPVAYAMWVLFVG